MNAQQIESLLQSVRDWPREDRDELVEAARDIEARRSGVYQASADELAALDDAESSGIATPTELRETFEALRRA
ncbi:MAG TPA: hypothetical protein VMF67_11110 [Rhizomicrobium sp.]|nr:hypothetical protein [Rhizomicrobium sp.]